MSSRWPACLLCVALVSLAVGCGGDESPEVNAAPAVAQWPQADALFTMHWGFTREGLPASFFPDDGDVWFWPGDGERIGSRGPLIVLIRVRRDSTGQPGWDFDVTGWQAVLVPNPDDRPDAWRVVRLQSPRNPWRILVGSASVLAHRGWLYAFGVREPSHDVHVARFRLDAAAAGDLRAPEWWAGKERGFVEQASLTRAPIPVSSGGQTEFTVHRAKAGRFVVVQTVGFGRATIGIRAAPALTGPWSRARSIWRPPESASNGGLIYAAKAHPELDTGDGLAVTYIPSNFDLETVIADESLYYPRFARLREP